MKKIIILSSLGIGDVITLHPLLKKLHNIYPDSKILIYSFRGGYLENYNLAYVDEIIILRGYQNVLRFFSEKSDILVSLGHYYRGSEFFKIFLYYLIILLTISKSKLFWGDLESVNFENRNMVKIKLDILEQLNITVKNSDYNLFLPFSFKKEIESVSKLLLNNVIGKHCLLTVIHVGARDGDCSRLWPIGRWVQVTNYLINKHRATICFIGGPDDIEISKSIIKKIKRPIVNFVGKLSLQETAALIDKCRLFISTNSGPMWIAAALHKSQIALCGPSKTAWDPYNTNAIVIRKNDQCMKSISVEDVTDTINQLLDYTQNIS